MIAKPHIFKCDEGLQYWDNCKDHEINQPVGCENVGATPLTDTTVAAGPRLF